MKSCFSSRTNILSTVSQMFNPLHWHTHTPGSWGVTVKRMDGWNNENQRSVCGSVCGWVGVSAAKFSFFNSASCVSFSHLGSLSLSVCIAASVSHRHQSPCCQERAMHEHWDNLSSCGAIPFWWFGSKTKSQTKFWHTSTSMRASVQSVVVNKATVTFIGFRWVYPHSDLQPPTEQWPQLLHRENLRTRKETTSEEGTVCGGGAMLEQ